MDHPITYYWTSRQEISHFLNMNLMCLNNNIASVAGWLHGSNSSIVPSSIVPDLVQLMVSFPNHLNPS
ncbi:hypothetical protein Syun_030221 [Stephania yunnanensis]|uniref:Uncharacterized protein n=1 Tax=Stephania yunnanensis TaxID=152371 RepID=A0AAP0EBL6_9MAGN